MKLLVIGCGSIGKRHIRNALEIVMRNQNIIAVDTRDDRLQEVKNYGVEKVFKDFEDAIKEEFDIALICSPTSLNMAFDFSKTKKTSVY